MSARDRTKVLLDEFERTEAAERRVSLHALIHRMWFPEASGGSPRNSVPLADILEHRAKHLLQCQGSAMQLAQYARDAGPESAGSAASAYRFQVTYLPPDLLVAAACSAQSINPAVERPDLMPPSLRNALAERVAEVHQHVKAAVPFELLWLSFMRRLSGLNGMSGLFNDPAAPFGGGTCTLAAALMAAVSREVLVRCLVGPLAQQMAALPTLRGTAPETLNAIRAMAQGRVVCAWRPLQQEYAARNTQLRGEAPSVDALRHADPVERILGSGAALGETRMLAQGIAASRKCEAFALLFWQYVRIRGMFYQFLTQHHGTEGFSEFQRYFNRISQFRKGAMHLCAITQASVGLTGRGLGLESMEVRLSPSDKATDYEKDMRAVSAGARAHPSVKEVGAVIHLERTFHDDCHRPECAPGGLVFPFRFGHYFHKRRIAVDKLCDAIRTTPTLLRVLRGLDLCAEELAVPGFILYPLLKHARDVSRRACAGRKDDLRPLQMTVHAGEDFARLIQGLRVMDEPVEWGLLERGDRVGHGFALALDPKEWGRTHEQVAQRSEERLEDLLWELNAIQLGRMAGVDQRYPVVEREALTLATKIYGDKLVRALGVAGLIEARARRFTWRGLAVLGFPDQIRTVDSEVDRLNLLHLTDLGVYRRSQEVELVTFHPSEELAITAAQSMVRKAYAAQGITIEALPSSNLMTQAIRGVDAHPVFDLVDPDLPENERVGVTIGDDDPVTLATSLPDEFAYVHAALLKRGHSSESATQWIRQLCDTGWRARFTQPLGRGAGKVER